MSKEPESASPSLIEEPILEELEIPITSLAERLEVVRPTLAFQVPVLRGGAVVIGVGFGFVDRDGPKVFAVIAGHIIQ